MSGRPLVPVVLLVLLLPVASCGAPDATTATDSSPSIPPATAPATTTRATTSTAPATTSTTPATTVPGIDERHGTVGGRAWTVRTRLDEVGSVCLELWWDDEADRWSGCFDLAAYPGPLPWVPATPPTGGEPVTFVLGVSRVDARTVEVWRGGTRMGSAAALDDLTVDIGGSAFAVPLEVGDAAAMVGTAPVGSADLRLGVGTLPEMLVRAIAADGTELAVAGRPIGVRGTQVCLVAGEVLLDCPDTAQAVLAGFRAAAGGVPAHTWIVIADQAAAAVTMRQHTVAVTQHVTAVPPARIAVFPLDASSPFSVTFTVHGADGGLIGEYGLGQFLGG